MRSLIGPAGLLVLAAAAPAGAQAVLDWPLLLEARPAALVTGAGAVLGSPAGLAHLDLRAEGIVSDLETPEEMGLRALTVAGAVRLFDDWTVGAAYRHVGVGDMLRTDGPPTGMSATPMEIAEDVFALAVGARFGAFSAGVGARLDTPAAELREDESWATTIGAAFTPRLPFIGLRLAGTLEIHAGGTRTAAAAEAVAPALLDEQLELALAYGARDSGVLGFGHSLVASGSWRDTFELQAGATAEPGADAADWVPLFAGLVHLGRYRLGIVREHLPNGFGAAMHYRLSVAF